MRLFSASRAAAARRRPVPAAGAVDRRHPPRRLRRHLRRTGGRAAGEKAGRSCATRISAPSPPYGLCCYFVASFAIWAAMPRSGSVLILVFCLSRTLSGLAVAWFPLAKNTGLAHTFAAAADRKRVCRILAAASDYWGAALCISGWGGLAAALAAVCVFCWYKHMTRVQFGDLSGDLAGWFCRRRSFGCSPPCHHAVFGGVALIFVTGPLFCGKENISEMRSGLRRSV